MSVPRGELTIDAADRPATVWRVLRVLGAIVTLAITLSFTAAAVATFALHLGIRPVLSPSMSPTYDPGWAIITRPIPIGDVRVGDIVVFTPPGESSQFAHRVVSIERSGNGTVIRTKGDANPAPDPWHARLNGSTVPEVIGEVPHLGTFMVFMQQQSGHVLVFAVLGLVVCITGTRTILGRPHPEPAEQMAEPPTP